jgi:hypothetical protein
MFLHTYLLVIDNEFDLIKETVFKQ